MKVQKLINRIIIAGLICLLFSMPFLVSKTLYNGINMAKEIWCYSVVSLILFYAGLCLFFKKGPVKINLNMADIFLLTFFVWCFIRALFSIHASILDNHKLWVLSVMMVIYFFIKSTLPYHFIYIFYWLCFAIMMSGFLEAVYGLMQLYGLYPSPHPLFKVTGSFSNPAYYALYLAAVFPFAFGIFLISNKSYSHHSGNMMVRMRKKPSLFLHSFMRLLYYLSGACLISILLVIPATLNRASWLGIVAGGILIMSFRYNLVPTVRKWFNKMTIKKAVLLSILSLAVAISAIGIIKFKSGSSMGRLLIWEVTLGKIKERPIIGHGLGSFEVTYNNWQAQYFQNNPREMNGIKGLVAGNSKYAFNEYLEMASEIGLLGLIFFLAAVVTSLYAVNQFIKKNRAYGTFLVFTLIPALITLLICACVSIPFYSVSTLMIFFTMLGIASSFHDKNLLCFRFHSIYRVGFVLISILLSAAALFPLPKKISFYKTLLDATVLYEIGEPEIANTYFARCYHVDPHEGILLQLYGKSLLKTGRIEEAIRLLEASRMVTSDAVLYTNLGDAYKSVKKYELAEKNYLFSSYMEPHKLYPHYLLAKLYMETGQNDKAISKAREVIQMDAKTGSKAVSEIKTEMKAILIKLDN